MAGERAGVIRRLPDEDWQPVVELHHEGRLLQVQMASEQTAAEMSVEEALVEVETEENIYLGVVRNRKEKTLEVALEHILNRGRLSAVRKAWHKDESTSEGAPAGAEVAAE